MVTTSSFPPDSIRHLGQALGSRLNRRTTRTRRQTTAPRNDLKLKNLPEVAARPKIRQISALPDRPSVFRRRLRVVVVVSVVIAATLEASRRPTTSALTFSTRALLLNLLHLWILKLFSSSTVSLRAYFTPSRKTWLSGSPTKLGFV